MPSPLPLEPRRGALPLAPILIIIAVVVVGLGFGYFAYRAMPKAATVKNTNTLSLNTNNSENINATADLNNNVNARTANTNIDIISSATPLPRPSATGSSDRKTSGLVSWTTPKKIASLHLFKTSDGYNPETSYNSASAAAYYSVGTVRTGKYAGDVLVMVMAYDQGPYMFPFLYYFAQQGSKLTLLTRPSTGLKDSLNQDMLAAVDTTFSVPDLDYPSTITGPNSRQTITNVEESARHIVDFFNPENLKVAYKDPTYGTVFTTSKYGLEKYDVVGANANLFAGHGFYLRAPDGTVRVYEYQVPFVHNDTYPATTDIIWLGSTKSASGYGYQDVSGCGAYNYAAVQDPTKISITTDFVKTGTTKSDGPVYELKDVNHTLLKTLFGTYVSPNQQTANTSYSDFLAHHPIIFWVDPFDRIIKLTSTDYQPLAECGKPVIYLYSPKAMDVTVNLQPAGGFTYTEPLYNTGWHVHAQPDGTLTNLADGKTYPYLFWEGRGGLYQAPDKGFVVAKQDVHTFLTTSLKKLGLNAKETADFQEFWEPRMQAKPYYFVSFYGTSVMDQLAPLTITPKPDTVIRILMDFKGLDAAVPVTGYQLRSIPRKGFTVIEWGGVIQ